MPDPILKDTYEKNIVHDEWISVYRSNPLQAAFNEILMDKIVAWMGIAKGAAFLDAGCGTGDHAIRLARRGYSVTGVDLSDHVLETAGQKVHSAGLDDKIQLQQASLENLQFPDSSFDAVHCRGVLMHIPGWRDALRSICRVLKPGGRIVIMEGNQDSFESGIVQTVRKLGRRQMKMNRTEDGIEYWAERDGTPFLVRALNQIALEKQLEANGVRLLERRAAEFWDINRFPGGLPRNLSIRFNRFWLGLGFPSGPCSGVLSIGQKK